MAPKVKITKEEIIKKGLLLIKEEQVLTASTLSKYIGVSTQPIFSHFSTLEEVKEALYEEAMKEFKEYLLVPIEGIHLYKAVGLRYIEFATTQKGLFKYLFFSTHTKNESILNRIEEVPELLDLLCKVENISAIQALQVSKILWIYAHGIACLNAMNIDQIKEEEIHQSFEQVYFNVIGGLKNETITK